MSDESLNEFWKIEGKELDEHRAKIKEEQKLTRKYTDDGKQEVDAKLAQFLNIHSMNLSTSVRNYIEKSKNRTLKDEETIASLGLIAHERKKFLKSLTIVEDKFQRRLEEVKMLSK